MKQKNVPHTLSNHSMATNQSIGYSKPELSATQVEWIFLSIIGILFFSLNYYSILGWDDWIYAMKCEDTDFFKLTSNRTPINSLKDILQSQYNHYQYVNGRFLIHFIVQLFVGILGLRAFQVANTIMFVLLIKYLCRLCIPIEFRNKFQYYIFTFFYFWFIFGLTMLIGFSFISVIAFSVNYLWSTTLFVSVIYVFYKYKDLNANIPLTKKWLIFLLSLLCGASHEAFSIGLSASLLFYSLFYRKENCSILNYLTIGLFIGSATLIFSPANFIRVSTTTETGLIYALKLRLDQFGLKWVQLIPFAILLIISILGKLRKGKLNQLLKDYKFLQYAAFFTFAFLLIVGMSGNAQMFTSITIITIIILVKYLFSFNFIHKYYKLFVISSILILGIHFILILQYRQQENTNYNAMFNEYVDKNSDLITFKPTKHNLIITSYGIDMTSFKSIDFSFNGINQYYFNVKRPYTLIPDLSKGITSYNKIAENNEYSIYDDDYFFIVKLIEPENNYDFYTENYSFDSIMLRIWFKYYAQRPEKIKVYSDRIEYNDEIYYIIRKKQQDKTIHNIKINEI